MGYAEKIYEKVKLLPDPVAEEILNFAEFVAARRADATVRVDEPERERRRAEIERVFAKYRLDLSGFKFDREEANARR